jgi:hypothetical protein
MYNVLYYLYRQITTTKTKYMKTSKKARYSTATNSKVGDTIAFLKIPYYTDDKRMYWEERKIISIELSKTGKRVKVVFNDGYIVDQIAPNTNFEYLNDKFLDKMTKELGWR